MRVLLIVALILIVMLGVVLYVYYRPTLEVIVRAPLVESSR